MTSSTSALMRNARWLVHRAGHAGRLRSGDLPIHAFANALSVVRFENSTFTWASRSGLQLMGRGIKVKRRRRTDSPCSVPVMAGRGSASESW